MFCSSFVMVFGERVGVCTFESFGSRDFVRIFQYVGTVVGLARLWLNFVLCTDE